MNIPEGAEFSQMPRFGFGTIGPGERFREYYVTARIFGLRLFAAAGHELPSSGWWFRKYGVPENGEPSL